MRLWRRAVLLARWTPLVVLVEPEKGLGVHLLGLDLPLVEVCDQVAFKVPNGSPDFHIGWPFPSTTEIPQRLHMQAEDLGRLAVPEPRLSKSPIAIPPYSHRGNLAYR